MPSVLVTIVGATNRHWNTNHRWTVNRRGSPVARPADRVLAGKGIPGSWPGPPPPRRPELRAGRLAPPAAADRDLGAAGLDLGRRVGNVPGQTPVAGKSRSPDRFGQVGLRPEDYCADQRKRSTACDTAVPAAACPMAGADAAHAAYS